MSLILGDWWQRSFTFNLKLLLSLELDKLVVLFLELLLNLCLFPLHLLIGFFLLDLFILLVTYLLILLFLLFAFIEVTYLLLDFVFLGFLVLEGSCSGQLNALKLLLLGLLFFVPVCTLRF